MKTRDQKNDDRISNRATRWWSKIVDWAENVDFGEICLNVFFVLLIGGTIFGLGYLTTHKSSKEKVDTIVADSTVVEKQHKQCIKSCAVDWDLDTMTVLAPNEKGYKLHFKGKVPYYLTIENLDSVQ